MTQDLQIYTLQSGALSGIENMALDETLLESVRSGAYLQADAVPWQAGAAPVLIVRTYCWREPTLSLGVNQQVRDIEFLLDFYGKQSGQSASGPVRAVVRRPTGGRAILHGQDISYAFITNDPAVLKQSLKASYQIYADIVRAALHRLSLAVQSSGSAAGERDYLRSPVCFETHTPSDLLGPEGQKLTGSAQLRRSGGLLQHGAAFLTPYGVSEAAFSQVLFEAAAQAFNLPVAPYPPSQWEALAPAYHALQASYAKSSGEILAKVPTISGSHFTPDSF